MQRKKRFQTAFAGKITMTGQGNCGRLRALFRLSAIFPK